VHKWVFDFTGCITSFIHSSIYPVFVHTVTFMLHITWSRVSSLSIIIHTMSISPIDRDNHIINISGRSSTHPPPLGHTHLARRIHCPPAWCEAQARNIHHFFLASLPAGRTLGVQPSYPSTSASTTSPHGAPDHAVARPSHTSSESISR
jgi:hypothetical protein